uniref:Uncharacterized protein n=1 Tax=Anguilla anguilla TaxID=7936 RepID=A0A0E9PYR7_ANGAN
MRSLRLFFRSRPVFALSLAALNFLSPLKIYVSFRPCHGFSCRRFPHPVSPPKITVCHDGKMKEHFVVEGYEMCKAVIQCFTRPLWWPIRAVQSSRIYLFV